MGKAKKYELSEFCCARCGNCCKGEGIVVVSDAETAAAAKVLEISVEEFRRRFTTESQSGERWLIDKFVELERWCVFLQCDERGLSGCAIQRAKPEQCSNFPLKWRTREMIGECKGLKP